MPQSPRVYVDPDTGEPLAQPPGAGRAYVDPATGDPMVNIGERASFTVNAKPVSAEDFLPPRTTPNTITQGLKETLAPADSWEDAKALFRMATWDPLGTASGMVGGLVKESGERMSRGAQALGRGDALEGISQILAGLIPGIGPMIRETGEAFGSGDVRRGIGRAAGMLAPGAAFKGGRTTSRLARQAVPELRQGAVKAVTQALDPRKEKWKAVTQQIAPEVAERRISGSREGVLQQASREVERAGDVIEDFWGTPGRADVPLPVGRMVGEIELQKGPFRNIVKDASGNPIKVVDLEPRTLAQLTKIQEVLDAHGDTISSENARRLLQNWAGEVAERGGYAHRRPGSGFLADLDSLTEVWAKREGADAIRQVLADAHPDLRAINREFTFWKRLHDVVDTTQARTAPHRSRGLSAQIGRATGAAIGASTGNPVVAVLAGEAGARLSGVFNGPRWKLFTARQKMALADALASGNAERAQRAIGKVLAIDLALTSGAAAR